MRRVANLSTGFKLFLLLSLALLPPAMIVFFAAVQSIRDSRNDRMVAESQALDEASARLAARLASDVVALRIAANSRAASTRPAGSAALRAECDRTEQLLSAGGRITSLGIVTANGSVACGTVPVQFRGPLPPNSIRRTIAVEDGALIVSIGGQRATTVVSYPAATLANIARPGLSNLSDFALVLMDRQRRLPLVDEIREGGAGRRKSLDHALGQGDLRLQLRSVAPALTPDQILLMLLPIVMWLAAAGLGWLAVDRLLLRPLARLRTAVGAYRPGEIVDFKHDGSAVAREIIDLGDTFRDITDTVSRHEGQLEDALANQRKLTREVHHRVKNNLQVVASLINIHARGVQAGEAADAYATIQRRVDALAVVHRNHYAEMEVNLGVAIRPLVGEISSNLRATAPPVASRMAIQVDVAPLNVTQDVAVPLAFMITELVELAMASEAAPRIAIKVEPDEPGRARLTVRSAALVSGPDLEERVAARYGRVLEGLARQLRTKLRRDPDGGSFSIDFALLQK
ncbi:two-component sensor histidine kinase [Sphingomonas jejuensis]|uniref:histidine kinase n=1 Tax=Sphingomonas jejuensis TaxID=904715 RepID=A0ABX0XH69_9SPHN|nr:two-component sensor histidine kinase [Sphingomonas jejuensis]